MTKTLKNSFNLTIEKWKKLPDSEIANLLVMIGLLIGAGFRLMFPLLADFPIGDGGLFYKIVQTLQENQYRLPDYVTYNGLTIPFTYPPLAFYLVGKITDIFNFALIDVMRWFPAIVLILSLPVFYILAKTLMDSPLKASIALIVLALFPRSVTWLIKGGGITRSLGQLFFMVAVGSFYLLFKSRDKKYLFSSIIASVLVCVTHPEAALHSVGIGFLMWLFYGRNKEGILHATLIGVGTAILTSIWWLPIISNLGLSPFLHAAQTGWNELSFVFGALFVPITDEPLMTVISVLMILGFFIQIVKRKYLLPAFLLLPFIVEPRNAPNIAVVPASMLAGIAISDLIFPIFSNLTLKTDQQKEPKLLRTRAEWLILFYLIISLFIGTQIYIPSLLANQTTLYHRIASDWIRDNTSADSVFLVITHDTFPLNDPLNEWFPVITDRKSLTTVQGYEWLEDGYFNERIEMLKKLQSCDSISCIETEAQKFELPFQYLFIADPESRLGFELRINEKYKLIYENEKVLIFEKRE